MRVEKMDLVIVVGIVLAIIPSIVCPPVNPNKIEEKVKDAKEAPADDIEYKHYLEEVVDLLESDDHFREQIALYEQSPHMRSDPALELEYNRYLREIMEHLQNDDDFKKSIEEYKDKNNGSHPENLDYEHYLKEVTETLEEDEDFRKKMDKFNTGELKQLEYERYFKEITETLEEDDDFRKKIDKLSVGELEALGLEYEKYLKEIFTTLEEDEAFRDKIAADPDVKRNDISRHLEFVSHNVRSKLDEIKRREIDRIKSLMKERVRQQQGKDVDWKSIMPGMDHLDIKNPEAFDVTDLDKLIKQATKDLDDIDQKRRDEFKQYELQKEHERREKLRKMDAEHKKKAEEEYENLKKKHKEHPKLHEPGSKAQLEEVWEKEDHLDKNDFEPKSFFALHDTNNDGFLTADEVEALFNSELQKLYEEGHPEDDMVEKFEEMNRMREKVYKEIDANRDGAISLEEFMNSTKAKDFEQDEGWKPLDEQEPFSEDELKEYETHLKDEGEGDVTEKEEHAQKPVMDAPQAAGVVQMEQKEIPKAAENVSPPAPPQK